MQITFILLTSLAMTLATPVPVPQTQEPKWSVGTPACCNGATTPLNLVADSCIRCPSSQFLLPPVSSLPLLKKKKIYLIFLHTKLPSFIYRFCFCGEASPQLIYSKNEIRPKKSTYLPNPRGSILLSCLCGKASTYLSIEYVRSRLQQWENNRLNKLLGAEGVDCVKPYN